MTKPIRLDMQIDASNRKQPGIEALNRYEGCALTEDGVSVELVRFFDKNGKDCKPEWALSCVGKDQVGRWWSIDLTEFEERRSI